MKLKKSLGQHFLQDENIIQKIADSITQKGNILEVGAGAGALTKYLYKNNTIKLIAVEIDQEKCDVLAKQFNDLSIIKGDILKIDPPFQEPFRVVGNFPYNISSQIIFKLLDWQQQLSGIVGMFQKEVAQRISSPPNSKQYGILSVLVQSYFDVEYLFDVPPTCFKPPPKVMSGVIQLTPKTNTYQGDYSQLKKVVKLAFSQRRKMLRNTLSELLKDKHIQNINFEKRAEHLSVEEFQLLCDQL